MSVIVSLAAPFSLAAARAGDTPLRPLCVQLKWLHQAQFAGFYLAKDEGLFAREGIEVSFREGGPAVDWQVRMRDADCPLGITDAAQIVVARAEGVPVTAVAAVDQVSPIVWFSLRESGIRDPRQFAGKRVVVVPTGRMHFRGMLHQVGVPLDAVDVVPFSLDLGPLYRGEVDVWSGYHTNLVTRAEMDGHPVQVIHPVNYGVQIYDDVIYARDDLIAAEPALVTGFLRAALEGWAEVIRDPARGVECTMRYRETDDRALQERLLRRTIPYVHTGEAPVGWMEAALWGRIAALAADVGLAAAAPPADELFTSRFLDEVYGR